MDRYKSRTHVRNKPEQSNYVDVHIKCD